MPLASCTLTIWRRAEPWSELAFDWWGPSMSKLSPRQPQDQTTDASLAPRGARLSFETRCLKLSGNVAVQLIRDAIGGGGEIWVKGSGQSMFPTIRNADPVLLSPLRRPPRRGDIVLVPLGPRLMLHRVVSVGDGRITTRGDARVASDLPIPVERVLARAVAVRRDASVSALVPTLRFGIGPLARYLLATARRHASIARRRLWDRRPAVKNG